MMFYIFHTDRVLAKHLTLPTAGSDVFVGGCNA